MAFLPRGHIRQSGDWRTGRIGSETLASASFFYGKCGASRDIENQQLIQSQSALFYRCPENLVFLHPLNPIFMALHTIRTNSAHPDFVRLVQQLDTYLAVIDGSEHAFYHQFNKIDHLNHVVILYQDDEAVACGAVKEIEPQVMEVKRMFTDAAFRGRGYATIVLDALEGWSKELGAHCCRLETGKRMPDAVALYQRNGYQIVPNYGQYIGVENSLCFEKSL